MAQPQSGYLSTTLPLSQQPCVETEAGLVAHRLSPRCGDHLIFYLYNSHQTVNSTGLELDDEINRQTPGKNQAKGRQ